MGLSTALKENPEGFSTDHWGDWLSEPTRGMQAGELALTWGRAT